MNILDAIPMITKVQNLITGVRLFKKLQKQLPDSNMFDSKYIQSHLTAEISEIKHLFKTIDQGRLAEIVTGQHMSTYLRLDISENVGIAFQKRLFKQIRDLPKDHMLDVETLCSSLQTYEDDHNLVRKNTLHPLINLPGKPFKHFTVGMTKKRGNRGDEGFVQSKRHKLSQTETQPLDLSKLKPRGPGHTFEKPHFFKQRGDNAWCEQ